MTEEVRLVFVTVVVSWVIFTFNFVLGYYMGRTVESAEKNSSEKDETIKK